MITPINIKVHASNPTLPLPEAVTFVTSPSAVFICGVPPNYGRWAITAISVAATFPDGSTTTRAAVQSANGVWVATLPATATSGRTTDGFRVIADGIDENGEAATGYILAVADFAVASLDVTPAPQPGETSWQMLYFDAVPSVLRKGDVTKIDGVLKFYNGEAWEAFATPPALDDAVTRDSANGVKSSGIWSAIWGALAALPTGFSSLYDWCVSQLAGKENIFTPAQITPTRVIRSANAQVKVGTTTYYAEFPTIAMLADKQNALTAQQLANIAAVPDKLDKSGGTMTGSLTLYEPQNGAEIYFPSGGKAKLQFGSGLLNVDDTTGRVTINQKDAAVVDNIPYDRITITTGQLQDHAEQKVALNAATTTLTLPALTDLTGKVSDFGIDVVNGYEVSGTPTAASFTLDGTLGTDYNLIVPEGEDWSEMSTLAAGEMAVYYFTLSAFAINDKPTWEVMKKVVKLVPVPSAP